MRPASSSPRAALSTRRAARAAAFAVVAGTVFAAGCAPQPEPKAAPSSAGGAASCAPGKLATETTGKLTVGTDKPAYAPWFKDDKPSNGQGYESRCGA